MKCIITLLFTLCVLTVSAQDVKIQGPKRKQTTTSKSKPKPSSGTQSSKPIEVYYDSSQKAIVYGNNHYNLAFVAGGIYTICEDGSGFCSADAQPHKVSVTSFSIGQTEVTQGLWKAVVGRNPSIFKGDDLPVENVSWDDCQEFISKLNTLTGKSFSLPTEAEWEFAARGGNLCRVYTKYSGSNYPDDVCWYESNSDKKTHPVATKQPNVLGLYDMTGNVSEWCQDWYGAFQNIPTTNPRGAATGSTRVRRGGNYNFASWIVNRTSSEPSTRSKEIGLRLCLHSEEKHNLGAQAYSRKDCSIDIYQRPDEPYNLSPRPQVATVYRSNIFEKGNWQGWFDSYLQIVLDNTYKTVEINIDEPILLYIQSGKNESENDGSITTTLTTLTTDGSNGKVIVRMNKKTDGTRTLTAIFSEQLAYCFEYKVDSIN